MGTNLVASSGSVVLSEDGRGLLVANGQPGCCCGECFYYRASLCNQQVCALGFPDIYVCTTDQCPSGPITPGSIIKYGPRCYLVGSTIYCPRQNGFAQRVAGFIRDLFRGGRSIPPGGTDPGPLPVPTSQPSIPCTPLPVGAVIAGPPDDCVPNCSPGNCPPIDGWFPMLPCPCPGNTPGPGCVVVKCSAYFASLGQSICPSWNFGGVCWYVAPNSQPTTDPGNCLQVTSPATHINCCHCCGTSGEGCCYASIPNRLRTWVNGNLTLTEGLPTYCCWEIAGYQASGAFTAFQTWNFSVPGCPTPPAAKYERRVAPMPGQPGFFRIEEQVTTWNRFPECPPCGCETVSPYQPITGAFSCADAELLMGLLVGGNLPTTGTETSNCQTANINGSSDGGPGGLHTEIDGTCSVTGGSGCGNPGACGPQTILGLGRLRTGAREFL